MCAAGWGPAPGDQPLPPQNGSVISPYIAGVLDLNWDDPSLLAKNAAWVVVGVNIYRSDVSDRGPFYRINEFPVGGTFYRDWTQNVQVTETVAWAAWTYKGTGPNTRQYSFSTTQHPVVKQVPEPPYDRPTPANMPSDVTIVIDGVEVPVNSVFGPTGEIVLINQGVFNVATEKIEPALLPTEDAVVEISYWVSKNHIRSSLDTSLFYRLTTVVIDTSTPSGYKETELEWCKPILTATVEDMDYIWREAVRRNAWILQQGGERVKIFIRRTTGVPCSCGLDPKTKEYLGQHSQRCVSCYGTGFIGGFEGPYEAIIAPDDFERRMSQGPTGRRKEHTGEVFMGPSPVVTQRDLIVKQTNERYSIAPSRRPTNRGNMLQQHFTIGYLDEQDIRYKVPIDGVADLVRPQTRYGFRQYPSMPVDGELSFPESTAPDQAAYPEGPDSQTPMQTDKQPWAEGTQQRGRSPVWENQNE